MQPARSRDLPFAPVFLVLAAVALAPIWRARILPLLDEPNHLSAVFIYHHIDDPWARLGSFYEVSIPNVPYLAYYLLVHLFAHAVGIEIANKIVQSAYVLAIPLAALVWTRRTGRSPWLSILAFPLAYSFSWSLGFHPFNVGVALFLFTLAAVDAFLERPRKAAGVAVALLGLACDYGHPLAVLSLYLSVPVLLLAHRPAPRRLGLTLLLLLPGAALFAWQVLHPQVAWVAPPQATEGPRVVFEHMPAEYMLRYFPEHTLETVSGPRDLEAFWVLVGSAVLLLAAGVLARDKGARFTGSGFVFRYRAALLALLMLGLYFAVPYQLERPFAWWFVGGRFAPLACFFAFLVPSGDVRGRKVFLFAPALLVALALPLHISSKYAAFNERARPFVRMVARARPGTDILFLSMLPRTDPAVNWEVYNQMAAWVQILHGGYSPSGWFDTNSLFKVVRHLPAPPHRQQEWFNPDVHAGPYHYIIVRNEPRPLFGDAPSPFHLVDEEGEWKMYARDGEPSPE
ncbi:hypothetical protein [Polyangium aurulentum]|uniref:hypothetical protein n=1 Tax=Polyangium aurulentum TaxID=2567896 RepID=UPI0010AE63B2|nr:hypothetical protein [Polyangium aurulentum]UQA54672.1 hypothetical protein E8A73_025205 [Polyangium aurulentum]